MSDWTSGYIAEIDYTYGYYQELNPLRAKLAFLSKGLVCPEIKTACELGFGQGVSSNIHAAASAVKWYGTDFSPSQASIAQELNEASGAGAEFHDQSFENYCEREDLPEFDFIGLHGIWSWISDENRSTIVDFIRRKLKVGGILYISYNTQPGWSAFAPMRHLMAQHAETLGSPGDSIANRINGSIEFAEQLLATKPIYSLVNPQIEQRIEKFKKQSPEYLAHEYFNRDWHPMHFSTVAEKLASAKLSYSGSAFYLDHFDFINLTPEQQKFLEEMPNQVLRESTRDFITNQQFRRDYWVKGARQLSGLERVEALEQQRVILVTHYSEVPLTIQAGLKEATLSQEIYKPLLKVLSDHKVYSLADLHSRLKADGIDLSKIAQAVMMLANSGHILPVQSDEDIASAKRSSEQLNRRLMHKARSGNEITTLASPVTGGGISINRFDQLFLLAREAGKSEPSEWVDYVWGVLSSQGQRLIVEGKPLESDAENLAELKKRSQKFAEMTLPILKAVQIA